MVRNNALVCPYHEVEETFELEIIDTDYDQDGYFRITYQCPNCKAVAVLTSCPLEDNDV